MTRPGAGEGIANRPATRPGGVANLPGLGEAGSRLPNEGAGIRDRMADRPQSLEDRRTDLSDRMSTGREDWANNRGDRQDDRQDWRDNNREDWQDFADDRRDRYGDWYNDSWHDHDWDPGDGLGYLWDNYPLATAFGLTRWGVNRLAYGFGYWGYVNPYASYPVVVDSGYSYAEPLVVYSDSATSYPADASATVPADASVPQASDQGMAAFKQARAAFYEGDFSKALTLLDTTLKTMPDDTVVHEFRGLVLFALQRFPESAAAIYAVLSAGPGWDWTTMSGLYPNVDVYTAQLRALEDFAKANPKSPDASFLLGYHYLTMGHTKPAFNSFRTALALLPGDKLLTQLIAMTTPAGERAKETPATPSPTTEVPKEKVLTVDKVAGAWTAKSDDARFDLELTQEGAFTWTFTRGETKESVKGAFAVDQDSLAMEPDAGGTMLAQIDFTKPDQFKFLMVGGEPNDPGLLFARK